MAVSVIPKSEFRRDMNVIEGYGEVPVVEELTDNSTGVSVYGWGLPNGEVTYSEKEARAWAKRIDKVIRDNLHSPQDLLVSRNA